MINIIVTFPVVENKKIKEQLLSKCKKKGILCYRINLAKINMLEYFEQICKTVELIRGSNKNSKIIIDIPYPGNYPRLFLGEIFVANKGDVIVAGNIKNNDNMFVNVNDLREYFLKGKSYLYNNGMSRMKVVKVQRDKVEFEVQVETSFISGKSIIAEKIKHDILEKEIKECIRLVKPDKLWCSFVEDKGDIKELINMKKEMEYPFEIGLKVENRTGCNNIDELIGFGCDIIIGRGDLGLNLGIEKLFDMQDYIIKECKKRNTKVCVATDILRTMNKSLIPSRADVTDISWIISKRVDSVMLNLSSLYSEEFDEIINIINRLDDYYDLVERKNTIERA